MTRAILTAFYPESFFVPLWQDYYALFFDYACMLTIEPARFNFAAVTAAMNAKLPELLKYYDLVMVADIDEILVPDPERWRDLGEYLDHSQDEVIRCVGYNVIQMPWQPAFDLEQRITDQRDSWQRDTLYDKPVITRKAIRYTDGNHLCDTASLQDPDLVMFHLRDADIVRTFERRQCLDNGKSKAGLLQRMCQAEPIPTRWRVI